MFSPTISFQTPIQSKSSWDTAEAEKKFKLFQSETVDLRLREEGHFLPGQSVDFTCYTFHYSLIAKEL